MNCFGVPQKTTDLAHRPFPNSKFKATILGRKVGACVYWLSLLPKPTPTTRQIDTSTVCIIPISIKTKCLIHHRQNCIRSTYLTGIWFSFDGTIVIYCSYLKSDQQLRLVHLSRGTRVVKELPSYKIVSNSILNYLKQTEQNPRLTRHKPLISSKAIHRPASSDRGNFNSTGPSDRLYIEYRQRRHQQAIESNQNRDTKGISNHRSPSYPLFDTKQIL